MSAYKGNGKCLVCGAPTKRTCKYCDKCRSDIKVKAWKKVHARRNADKQKEEPKKPVLSFSDVVKLADAAGMSYGKYCLKYGI